MRTGNLAKEDLSKRGDVLAQAVASLRPSPTRRLVVVLEPFHALGIAVVRRLWLDGIRAIAISDDQTAGQEFSSRMALEGVVVPHRLIDPQIPRCESNLAEDIVASYGRLTGVLSFFAPRTSKRRWLDLPVSAADHLMRAELNRRLRLLQALSPLLAGNGFMHNVVMGVVGADGLPRGGLAERAAARVWDDILAEEWAERKVLTRRTHTTWRDKGDLETVPRRDIDRVMADLQRCLRSANRR